MQHYNDRWRAYRKNIAQYMGTRNAVTSFQPMQEEENRRFLKGVLNQPEKLMDHIRTYVFSDTFYSHLSDHNYIM